MKIVKSLSFFLILGIFALNIFAQDEPEAQLFAELDGNSTRGITWSNLDGFFVQLQNNPNSQGYFYIYGTGKQMAKKQRLIRDYIKRMRFDFARITFVNVEDEDNYKMQFWFVPAGAEPPDVISENKNEKGDTCPIIKIIEPASVISSGENMTFTAEVKGVSSDIIYNWSIDKGMIINGQGTPTITVSTENLDDQVITASVSVSGNFLQECPADASGKGIVAGTPKAELIDQFTRANCEDVLARMDNFFVHLQNNPNSVGYIFIYGKRRAKAYAEREQRNWIKLRNFPADRIAFIKGGGNSDRAEIEFYIVPPGADEPEPASKPASEDTGDMEDATINKTKPYIFGSYSEEGLVECLEPLDLEGYADILKGNPKSRGNIVISAMTKENFREREKEILEFLTSKGIARKRLRTFYKRAVIAEGTELWILP